MNNLCLIKSILNWIESITPEDLLQFVLEYSDLSDCHKCMMLGIAIDKLRCQAGPPGSLVTLPDNRQKIFAAEYNLKERHLHVLSLLVKGKEDRQIAKELGFPVSKVKNLIKTMLLNTGTNNRTQLAHLAFFNGVSL